MMNKDELYIGVVEELTGGGNFNVKFRDRDKVVRCYRSGKMNKNRIWVMVGDKVEFWWTPKSSMGRIVKRL